MLENYNKIFASNNLSEAIENYRCISKDFQKFDNEIQPFNYSSYNFLECTLDEKKDFYNQELQLVESLVTEKIYYNNGIICNWYDIFKLLFDNEYAKIPKEERKVVFSTTNGMRPVGEKAYLMWNGLQIIDLDIKNKEIADALKPIIFEDLKKFNWFLGICTSSSGKSLHVWTKIDPITLDLKDRKIEYLCNFRQKYSYIYISLLQYMNRFNYTKEDILKYMDMAMCKPQQGILISSDKGALLNTNFKNLRLDINFEDAIDNGIVSIDWINHPDLKNIFSKLEWFHDETFDKLTNADVDDLSNIEDRDSSKNIRKHYKHAQRWQLANTLTNLYGAEKALTIMLEICKDTPKKELAGDIKTASIHNKPITLWAVKELNQCHGFKIKIKNEVLKDEFDKGLDKVQEKINKNNLLDPTRELNSQGPHIEFNIQSNEYLSSIQNKIIENLDKLTLLEAGAGYGKTEMVKQFPGRTLLVLPFNSIIESKIENSEVTDGWLTYYGNKNPSLEDIMGDRNMSMTIDKFSRIDIFEINMSSFEYIVFDESHLLFMSKFRDVMAPTIQNLANLKAKVIMMTGTPTGEKLFFPNIKHIKVIKEDIRNKSFEYILCPTKVEQTYELCNHIAKDIINGKHILFPTDKGNIYYDQICGIVQQCIDEIEEELPIEKRTFNRRIKTFYYKKSNYGDDIMKLINENKSIGDIDLLFCSTYLSVGVDICDKYDFNIYFSELMISQSIEQYANRIRNNDLHIHLFLPLMDNAGYPINYFATQPLDLSISNEEMIKIRDMLETCNDMLKRNSEENKYSPLINSIITSNNYLKYDENECKYYLDNTTYKLNNFEDNYKAFASQLEKITESMKYYGYDVLQHKNNVPALNAEKANRLETLMKQLKLNRYNEKTRQTLILLDHITDNNIDFYRDYMRGDTVLFNKDNKEGETLNLYRDDKEILEKNLPIILSLYKYYDTENIREIFKYCIERKTNRINYSKLERIRKLVNIEYNKRKKRLDFPVLKFVNDARKFAKENPEVTESRLSEWKQLYACKIANAIPGLIVDDNIFLEEMIEIVDNLFKVVIVQERPKQGKTQIKPFDLLWESKEELKDIYGTLNTQNFFLQDIIEKMKTDYEEEHKNEDENLPEFELANKVHLSDVQQEIDELTIKTFDYYDYSDKDGSNQRFLKKQENRNRLKDNNVFKLNKDEDDSEVKEKTLFDEEII